MNPAYRLRTGTRFGTAAGGEDTGDGHGGSGVGEPAATAEM
jgi:hypothetical protein